jgi:hypothetical protein
MGPAPVRFVRIAAMALIAAKFTMVFIFGNFTVNEDLFMRSQRLYFSASPLSFGFRGCHRFISAGFRYLPRDLYQFPWIRMAGETVILFFGGLRIWNAKS